MPEFPFIGGSYPSRSSNINAQRSINLYPVIDESGKTPVSLYNTPGLTEFCDTGGGTVRQLCSYSTKTELYATVDNTLYSIDTSGTATSKGTLTGSSGNVWMEDNGNEGDQLMIVDAADNKGYIYNRSTDVFGEITDADFPGASSLTTQDGRFIITRPNTQQFWISDDADGTSWGALNFASTDGEPDDLVASVSDHRELWQFGSRTIEIWYNAGTAFPFARKIDEIIQRGLGAPASVAKEDNTIFWLDDRGIARRAMGYNPKVISKRPIEYQWSTYSTIADAIGFTYVQDGHTFYVLTFPTGNATWVYDVSTDEWHERQSFPSPYDNIWRANCYAYFDGKHLVGDHSNGKIYEMDLDVFTEDGNIQKASRTAQILHKDRYYLFHNRLEIDFEAGVGTNTGQGVNPQAMLRFSDDGGHTYSNEHWASIGKMGEYAWRAVWRKLGRSDERIYEVTITDPVKRVIIGAHIYLDKGTY